MFSTLRPVLFTSLATLALGLTAAAASAQSGPPGSCECAIPAAPVVVATPELPRWGIGLRMGGMSLAPESAPDAKTDYAVGGLTLTYRLRPRWQLELAVDHATEQREDGTEGDRQLQLVTLGARYHVRPYARWDWYLLAGIGATADGSPDLSEEMRRETQQGHVHLGAGIERRWNHLGVSAELRIVGMAPVEPEHANPADTRMAEPGGVLPPAQDGGDDEGTSGGQFTIGAAYYF